jgi:hypothetical protein
MSAYDDLMAGSVGDVDIGDVEVGDPAAMTEALAAKLYAERPFTREDEVDLGVYDGVAIAPAGTRQLSVQSDNPFKPLAICVPSWQAPGLQITNIKISAVNLIEGQAIPADMFTEVSNINVVSYPTIQTSGRIVFDLTNASAAPITPNIGIKGKRIRGA